MRDAALIVFAKAPIAGQVKTRLAPEVTPEQAARLYRAFLLDALEQYSELDIAVRLYVAPPIDAFPTDLVPEGVSLHEQHGDGLGARMQHAFIDTFGAGYGRAVIIGTDHPTLPTDFVAFAFEALEEPLSISIGPSEDGGYYLVGMNDFFPSLFANMSYSHPDVFADTMDRINDTNANLTILPTWYDVDTVDSLRRLTADLSDENEVAPRTREVLASFGMVS